jgi:hypothetical protein
LLPHVTIISVRKFLRFPKRKPVGELSNDSSDDAAAVGRPTSVGDRGRDPPSAEKNERSGSQVEAPEQCKGNKARHDAEG